MFRSIGAVALATAAVAAHAQAARDAFNPPMSIILQGTFARSSQDPETYQISGFAPSGGETRRLVLEDAGSTWRLAGTWNGREETASLKAAR